MLHRCVFKLFFFVCAGSHKTILILRIFQRKNSISKSKMMNMISVIHMLCIMYIEILKSDVYFTIGRFKI